MSWCARACLLMCILFVHTHLCHTGEQLFVFRQWEQANEISVSEKISFFFPPRKSLWKEAGSRTEVIAPVRLLLCFTVLHHLHSTFPRYAIQ